MAADELVEVNNSYGDSLQIVSFSGDPKKENWQHSIERDNVTWPSLWDGKGKYSETSIKYGINGFPTFVLINPKGEIVNIWSGYEPGSLKSQLDSSMNPERSSSQPQIQIVR
jgi:hypothetical protein